MQNRPCEYCGAQTPSNYQPVSIKGKKVSICDYCAIQQFRRLLESARKFEDVLILDLAKKKLSVITKSEKEKAK